METDKHTEMERHVQQVKKDAKEGEYGIFFGDEILVHHVEDRMPLIDKMLWENDTIMVMGNAKAGKSIFCLQMACALTVGEPFLDMFDVHEACEVLYIQMEGKRSETQRRITKMTPGVNCDLNNLTHINLPGAELDTDKGLQDIMQKLEHFSRKPRVVIIDPLYMAMKGDLKESTACKKFIENIRVMADFYQAAIIIVHHKRKPSKNPRTGVEIEEGDDAAFGSFIWKAFVDHILILTNRKNKDIYSLTCATQRSSEVIEKVDFILHQRPLLFSVSGTVDGSFTLKVLDVIEKAIEPVSPQMMMDITDISKASLYRVLSTLINQSKIMKTGTKKKPVYSLI